MAYLRELPVPSEDSPCGSSEPAVAGGVLCFENPLTANASLSSGNGLFASRFQPVACIRSACGGASPFASAAGSFSRIAGDRSSFRRPASPVRR